MSGFYDEIGGYHDEATGYSPSGEFCGECCRASCKGCPQVEENCNEETRNSSSD